VAVENGGITFLVDTGRTPQIELVASTSKLVYLDLRLEGGNVILAGADRVGNSRDLPIGIPFSPQINDLE
jgi:hypothetical protein